MMTYRQLHFQLHSPTLPDPPAAVPLAVGEELTLVTEVETDGRGDCEETIDYDPEALLLLNALPAHSHGRGLIRAEHTWQLRALRPQATTVRLQARTASFAQTIEVEVLIQEGDTP